MTKSLIWSKIPVRLIPLYLYLYIQYYENKILIIGQKNFIKNFYLYLKFINLIIEKNNKKELL